MTKKYEDCYCWYFAIIIVLSYKANGNKQAWAFNNTNNSENETDK